MKVIINIMGEDATFDGESWECREPEVLKMLKSQLEYCSFQPSDDNPILTEAKRMAELFSGRVVAVEGEPPPSVPGRVY